MEINFKNRRMWQIGLLTFAVHTAFIIIKILPSYLFSEEHSQPTNVFVNSIIRLAVYYYLLAFMTPLILWLGYRLPLARRFLWRNLLIHVLVAFAVGVIHTYCYALLIEVLTSNSREDFLARFLSLASVINNASNLMVIYAAIIALCQAYLYFRESEERAFNLQQAELQALKMQLHPHFFFNTLNAISALIYRSPQEADRMITRLGDLFRISLRKDKAQKIPLKEELEFLQAFFRIHQTLMGRRLQVEWEIPPETLHAAVPNLLLQPLAENAIQHGIAPLKNGGQIKICAKRLNGKLLLQISDNGQGFVSEKQNSNGGIGLANTQARLENLYGDNHKFSIYESAAGGVTVKIEIPFQEKELTGENEY